MCFRIHEVRKVKYARGSQTTYKTASRGSEYFPFFFSTFLIPSRQTNVEGERRQNFFGEKVNKRAATEPNQWHVATVATSSSHVLFWRSFFQYSHARLRYTQIKHSISRNCLKQSDLKKKKWRVSEQIFCYQFPVGQSDSLFLIFFFFFKPLEPVVPSCGESCSVACVS